MFTQASVSRSPCLFTKQHTTWLQCYACRSVQDALSSLQEADTASPKPASVYGNGVHEGASALESPFEPVTPGLDPEEGAITIHYGTVWQTPHLHGSLAGGQWQDHAMQQVESL